MDLNLQNKIAFISGSSRGIGKAIGLALAHENCTVYLNGRDRHVLEDAVNELKRASKNNKIFGICSDLTKSDAVKNALNQITKEQGEPAELVVASLGSGKSQAGYNVDDSEWDRMFELNFFAAVKLVREALMLLEPYKKGRVVCVSSICGCDAMPAPIPYSAAKTALLSFVKNTADQVAKNGVRINSVSPGNVLFEGSTWQTKLQQNKQAVLDYIQKSVPMNGFAEPEDIANMVVFLLSDQAKFITGANMIVDGGQVRKYL